MKPLLEEFSHYHGYQPLPLRPLSISQVGDVVASMLGGAAVAQVIQHKIHRDTEGLPGLVENQVRVWVDSNYLQRQNRIWVISKQQSSHEYPSIQSLKVEEQTNIIDISRVTQADLGDSEELSVYQEKRLAGLSDEARQILSYLAVIGQRTSFVFLKRIIPVSENVLLDAINELLEAQILQESRERQDYVLGTTDRKLLLKSLDEKYKKRIHQQIAEGLIGRAQASNMPLPHERIAAHMLAAGRKNKALLHWVYGAQVALQNSANETAAELIRNAHGILKASQSHFKNDTLAMRAEFELTLLRLQALERIGNYVSCTKLARRRRHTYETQQNIHNVARFWIHMAESLVETGELEEAQTLAMKILGIHNLPKEYLFLRSRAHRLCGKIYARKGSYENSVLCLQKSLVLARNLELSSEAEQAQSALAYQHFWAGFVTEAKTDFTDLWASAQERQDMPLIIRYTYMLGEIARAQNKPQLAEQFLEKSISIAKPAGNRLAVANGLAAISLVKSNKDALDALTICGQSLQILKISIIRKNWLKQN